MKKWGRFAILAAVAVLAVSGCGKKEKKETESETVAQVDTNPGSVIKLGPYKGLELTRQSTEVTDEELDARIQSILDANPTYEEVDRPAEEGDIVNIDYVGYLDGEEFDGGADENYNLTLGSGQFIDGFEDGLIGISSGEEWDLNLTFPDNYYEELAGKDVVFKVTANSVTEVIPAELDEEFVQQMSDFTTIDEFREDILKQMQEEKEINADSVLLGTAVQAVMSASEFDINEVAREQALQNELDYEEYVAENFYGISLEDMINYSYGMTLVDYENTWRDLIEASMCETLVVQAIADEENMTLTEEDLQYAADQLGQDLDYLKENDEEYLEVNALAYKVAGFIIDNAKIIQE